MKSAVRAGSSTESCWPRFSRRGIRRAALISGLALLVSCGGGKESSESISQPVVVAGDSAAAVIGTSGGMVELPSKIASISIANGSLASGATFSISNVGATPILSGVAPLLELSNGGATISGPVTVRVKYYPELLPNFAPEEALTLAYFENGKWIEYPTEVDTENKILIGYAPHFSRHSAKLSDVTTPFLAGIPSVTSWQEEDRCYISGKSDYDEAVRDLSVRLFGARSTHCLTLPYLTNGYSRYLPNNLENHAGLDFRASASPVFSLVNGRVITANLDAASGRSTLAIMSQSKRIKVFYLHCRSHQYVPVAGSGAVAKNKLAIGDTVNVGDQICVSGNIGAPAGEHLHVELKLLSMDPKDPVAQPPDYEGETAIGGGRCGNASFINYLGQSVKGCGLEYIRLNTLDTASYFQSINCANDTLAAIDGLCQVSVAALTAQGELNGSSSSCEIAAGASTCSVTLNWSSKSTSINPRVESNSPDKFTVLASGVSGGPLIAFIPYGGRKFQLKHGVESLAWLSIGASCKAGSSWSGSTCLSVSISGSLSSSASSCTIAAGSSACSVSVTWSTTNPVATSAVTSDSPTANTTLFSGNSGGPSTVSVPYGGRNFYLYNNAQLLANRTVTATCATGTTWNGSSCQAAVMSGSLSSSASSCTIAAGSSACSVSVTWSTTNPVATSAVTSDSPTANTTLFSGNSGGPSTVSVPYGGRNFYLYNNAQLLANRTVTATCATGTTRNGSSCR